MMGMTIEDAIAILKSAGGVRGATATAGHANYERGRDLEFFRCECSYGARATRTSGYDFIAKTERGAYLYVGWDGRSGIISCGPKGFHALHGTEPCI